MLLFEYLPEFHFAALILKKVEDRFHLSRRHFLL